jgi:hypothetical protein
MILSYRIVAIYFFDLDSICLIPQFIIAVDEIDIDHKFGHGLRLLRSAALTTRQDSLM